MTPPQPPPLPPFPAPDFVAPGVLRVRFAFPASSEDLNEHVNNTEYVRMMQEAAIAHVDAVGWPTEKLREDGLTWVVHSHRIEYRRPCFAGEPLSLYTWVRDYRRFRSTRRYRFVRDADAALLAEAETEWVFLDFRRGRPASIPDTFPDLCPVVPETAEASIGLQKG